MLNSGNISADNLTNFFRAVSQKRRSGTLRIKAEESPINIFLLNGKILGAQFEKFSLADYLVKRLSVIGNREIKIPLLSQSTAYDQYFSIVSAQLEIAKDEFQLLVRAYNLDALHQLYNIGQAQYEFEPQTVEIAPDYSLSLTAGQLLVDLESLKSALVRFSQHFESLDSAQHILSRAGQDYVVQNSLEGAIWEALESTHSVQEIRDLVVASSSEIQETLVAMRDRNAIKVEIASKSDEIDLEELSGQLVSVDVDVDVVPDLVLSPESNDRPERSKKRPEPDRDLKPSNPDIQPESPKLATAHQSESLIVDEQRENIFVLNDQGGKKNWLQALVGRKSVSYESLEYIAVVVPTIFLFVVALVGIPLLENWLSAVAHFTSGVY